MFLIYLMNTFYLFVNVQGQLSILRITYEMDIAQKKANDENYWTSSSLIESFEP